MALVKLVLLLSALALVAGVNATYLQVQGPVTANLTNNQSVYLGNIGPGESFYVQASATTTNASGVLVNIGWNRLTAMSVPSGWSFQASPLYESPMKLKITTSPSTPNGRYTLVLRAINIQNYSRLGNLTFDVYVNVSTNIYRVSVTPTKAEVGLGQPTNFHVTINNTGISDDPFVISAQGLPAWNLSDEVVALHSAKTSFIYPIYLDSPGTYPFNLTVSSATSPLIKQTFGMDLVVRSSLINDYSAISQGVIVSPIVFEPVYSIMLLLSYIYGALTGTG